MWPFRRKKEQRSMTLDEFMALAGTSNTGAGEYVSSGTAESLPAVMNAVTVISEAVATMPCYLYLVRNEKGKKAREWLDSHPVDHILNERPNAWQTPYQFKRMMIRHCLLNGNAYAVIQWGRDGFPAALHPYPPQSVNVEQTGEHNWRYCITDAYTGNTHNYLP
ncbi:phage portal protein, partial [Escherichia coli]|nr:phage portal protein [Escherichia coli]EIH8184452.1 phage portal protein [Escherichia coli]EKF0188405.1 phage portal protein [Escherichia coli]